MADKPAIRDGVKKIWRFIDVNPDHNPGEYICIQELSGYKEDLGNGKTHYRPAPAPAETRVVRMRMTDDGTMKNVHERNKTEA